MTGKEKPQSEERGFQDLQCWTQARYLEGAINKTWSIIENFYQNSNTDKSLLFPSCLAPAFNAVGFAWDNKSNPTQSQIVLLNIARLKLVSDMTVTDSPHKD